MSTEQGPLYREASAALDAAHKACFNHPDRPLLGMSHGPFSGVNVALGIIVRLENENAVLKERLKRLSDQGASITPDGTVRIIQP